MIQHLLKIKKYILIFTLSSLNMVKIKNIFFIFKNKQRLDLENKKDGIYSQTDLHVNDKDLNMANSDIHVWK